MNSHLSWLLELCGEEGCGLPLDSPGQIAKVRGHRRWHLRVQLKPWSFFCSPTLEHFFFPAENSSSHEAEKHFITLPRPRSMLKKRSLGEEKDRQGEEKETALHEELEVQAAPVSLPGPSDRQLGDEKKAISENLDPEVSVAAEILARVLDSGPLLLSTGEGEGILCVHVFFSS